MTSNGSAARCKGIYKLIVKYEMDLLPCRCSRDRESGSVASTKRRQEEERDVIMIFFPFAYMVVVVYSC